VVTELRRRSGRRSGPDSGGERPGGACGGSGAERAAVGQAAKGSKNVVGEPEVGRRRGGQTPEATGAAERPGLQRRATGRACGGAETGRAGWRLSRM
jgi:hypothetical protein